jgi:hypothetical protein
MKWGHTYEFSGSEKLLYTVLSWILAQSFPIDKWLNKILTNSGGLGGDPGWEIEHISREGGSGDFRVWADPEITGIEPDELIYSADEVYQAVKESLVAFGQAYPERNGEISEAIRRYTL